MLIDVKPTTAPSAKSHVPSSPSGGSLAEAKAAAALAATTAATERGEQASAASEAASSASIDRRRSARKSSNLPAWLSDQSGGRRPQQQRVTVTDMSMHGVGFVANEKVTVGAVHWIVVASEQLHLSTRLKIVFARQRPDGSWDAGGEFF